MKWAGGKGQLIPEISTRYPKELGLSITKYAEPFLGGGAVLFDILSRYSLDAVYIGDLNPWLINVYLAVRNEVDHLINRLKKVEKEYLSMDAGHRKECYYHIRDRYNEIITTGFKSMDVECATLFIFLNRTCFNGLYRVNRHGLFNVPSGTYKNPKICDESNLHAVSKALQNVAIHCADFAECASFVDEKTFVYFDPPYRPLTNTASFTSYTNSGFDDAEQERLADFVNKLSAKGASVIVSNSDPKNADPNDCFFDHLYSRLHRESVQANRMINSNPSARNGISELIIANF